jgi:hypothetical protein
MCIPIYESVQSFKIISLWSSFQNTITLNPNTRMINLIVNQISWTYNSK